jgi:predicted N-acetyltransferase YhbS
MIFRLCIGVLGFGTLSEPEHRLMPIAITRVPTLSVEDFVSILNRSGLAERRPVEDVRRLARMLEQADLILVAQDTETGTLVGVSRAITDFAYCCYLSELAVDRVYQGQGIGQGLIEATREAAGPESMCLLISAPGAKAFYQKIGMPQSDAAFMYPREQ